MHGRVPVVQPRAEGQGSLRVRRAGADTRLERFRASGSLRLLFPRAYGGPFDAVLLNSAGGLTGGDRFALEAAAGPGAHLRLTTQAAERAYRARPGTRAEVVTRLVCAPGARIDWLPQETILFDGAALARRLQAELAGDAALLAVESLVLGRAAMGEELRDLALRDRWEIRREGRPVLFDAIRIEGDASALAGRAGVLGGARALATLVLAAPGAAARLPAFRAVLGAAGGASALAPDLLFARAAAPDSFALRALLLPLVAAAGGVVPKVWRL